MRAVRHHPLALAWKNSTCNNGGNAKHLSMINGMPALSVEKEQQHPLSMQIVEANGLVKLAMRMTPLHIF